MRSVHKFNKLQASSGLQQQIFLKTFSLMHTHKHTDRHYELSKHLNLSLTFALYSAKIWQRMDSSAFIKKQKTGGMENKNMYNILEKQFHFFGVLDPLQTELLFLLFF